MWERRIPYVRVGKRAVRFETEACHRAIAWLRHRGVAMKETFHCEVLWFFRGLIYGPPRESARRGPRSLMRRRLFVGPPSNPKPVNAETAI